MSRGGALAHFSEIPGKNSMVSKSKCLVQRLVDRHGAQAFYAGLTDYERENLLF